MDNKSHLTIKTIQNKAAPILKKHRVKKAALFGSFAKKTNKVASDIDLLIDPPDGIDLLDFIQLKYDLEDLFQKQIDLVQYSQIKPIIREEVLSTQIPIYSHTTK